MTHSDPTPDSNQPPLDEGQDPKSGQNNDPEAISGAVEGGWNGSIAGTNDALEPGHNSEAQPTESHSTEAHQTGVHNIHVHK